MDTPETEKRGRGRPATGSSTQVVSCRLKLAQHAELLRRAKGAGITPSEFAQRILQRELKRRPGQGTRARLEREGKANRKAD